MSDDTQTNPESQKTVGLKAVAVSTARIFLEFLTIGATSFGGVVPYLRGSLVSKQNWLSDREFVLELFHGPTFAFKDVALQLLGNLFEFFLARKNARKSPGEQPERLTVVGATSGDTGRYVPSEGRNVSYPDFLFEYSAAIYGLRGKKNVSIFILHPKGRVSPIQEAQMTTVTDSNVHNIAVRGTFDECQVSSIERDAILAAEYAFFH